VLSQYSDWLWVGLLGLNPDTGSDSLCLHIQTSSVIPLASYQTGTVGVVSVCGMKVKCDADHSRLSSAQVKNQWSHTSTTHTRMFSWCRA
jgi:hypothetical protein